MAKKLERPEMVGELATDNDARTEAAMKRTGKILIDDKADHRPPLKHRERVVHFQGPLGKGGDISIREMENGTMQVRLFNLAKGAVVICPEENYRSTREASARSS